MKSNVKMNPEIKAKWVSALRSGEYKQGRGRLRSPQDGFCCLGVLCDLAVKENVAEWRAQSPNGEIIARMGDGDCVWSCRTGDYSMNDVLPYGVSRWAGLGDFDDLFINKVNIDDVPDGQWISYLNDQYGLSFDQLADLIESNL